MKVIGSAIVSSNGFIADLNGNMGRIAHSTDLGLLQTRLSAQPCICIMGGNTHRKHPNIHERLRFVLTQTPTPATAHETFFNTPEELLAAITSQQDSYLFHVLGGSHIYTYFGQKALFTDFFLSVRPDVVLHEGIPLDRTGVRHTDEILKSWGLKLNDTVFPVGSLELQHWENKNTPA